MPITIDGTNGITTPGISNSEGYTGDGLTIAANAPAGALSVDASGRLLVGVTSGSYALDVGDVSGGNMFRFTRSGVELSSYISGGLPYFGTTSNTALLLMTNNAERARITSGGDLLVGTTSPFTSSLTTIQSATGASNTIAVVNTHASNPFGQLIKYTAVSPNGTGNQFFSCSDSTATRAEIRSNGGLANYSANNVNLSDARLKTDVQPADSYLDKICAIPVKTFLYKDQTDTERNLGVIAQDVDAVAPELIDHNGFGEAPEGESPYLAVYQTDLQYALMKCIQEQQALITALTARIEALEAK